MAHECVDCGELCYCDGEDHGQEQPDDCNCPCWMYDEDGYYYEDDV